MEKLVEIAKMQSTEASNAIEGIVTTNTRIKQLVEEKTTPRNRDEQEIAGQTKNVQNYISAVYPDEHTEILFTPLAPFETLEALDRICEEYNLVIGNTVVEPLIAIPVIIHDFLFIHPFNDGNG